MEADPQHQDKNLIYKYKNHPSLLMWNIGNELTYPLPINNKRKKIFSDCK